MTASAPTRVLIVEDVEDIRYTVSEVLQDAGYEVAGVENGAQALSWLRAAQELPDVILLDLMMPEMDGREFRAQQERDARFARVPIVLMTAAGDSKANVASLRADGYLQKPFKDIETILAAVERAVDAGRARPS